MLLASLPCSWREQKETIRRLNKDTRNAWDHKLKLLTRRFKRRTSTGSEAFSLFIYLDASK